jgi:PmbA protein
VREIIKKAAEKGAEQCEVFYLSSLRTSVEFEASRLKTVSNTEERGAALRLVKGGRLGFATSTKLDDIERLVDGAIATASCGSEIDFDFVGRETPADANVADPRVEELTVDEMVAQIKAGVDRIVDYEKKINIESSMKRDVQEISVVTSEGQDASFRRTIYEYSAGGRLVEGTNILDAYGYYGGTALEVDREGIVDRVIQDFKNGRKNTDVSSGPTTIMLTPNALADVMMTLHWGVNGEYVTRKISPLTGRLGETIFDERVTIYDDGLMAHGHGTAGFDDEGVPMQKTPVFEHGVLKSFLTDLRTSCKLDHPRTGNGLKARRIFMSKDLGKVPAPEITNWSMVGGEKSSEALVSELGDGIIVDRIMGIIMSNLIAGDFSGNVSLGFKVSGGKIVGRVKDTMIAGNVYKLFKDSLVAISSDVRRVGMFGGIGSHEYPYTLLKDVSISAGG